jgi:hypothetical protein
VADKHDVHGYRFFVGCFVHCTVYCGIKKWEVPKHSPLSPMSGSKNYLVLVLLIYMVPGTLLYELKPCH